MISMLDAYKALSELIRKHKMPHSSFYSDDDLIGLNQWIKLKVVKSRSVMYDVGVMV